MDNTNNNSMNSSTENLEKAKNIIENIKAMFADSFQYMYLYDDPFVCDSCMPHENCNNCPFYIEVDKYDGGFCDFENDYVEDDKCNECNCCDNIDDNKFLEELDSLNEIMEQNGLTFAGYVEDDVLQQLSDNVKPNESSNLNNSITEYDAVEHPYHYTSHGIETIDKIEAVIDGLPADKAAALSNVLRYFDRAGMKDDAAQDLNKANNYAHRLVYGKWRHNHN